MYQDVIFV